MNKKKLWLNILWIALIISSSLGLFTLLSKGIGDFLLAEKIGHNPPPFFIAEMPKKYSFLFKKPEVSAESALSVKIEKGREKKTVFQKNPKRKMAIASLTKLMTALVALQAYPLDLETTISKKAISQEEDSGQLKPGGRLTVENLIYITLIESSNDAAFSLSEIMGPKKFAALMNLKSKELGMEDSRFLNPTGLDIEDGDKESPSNISTAYDLTKLGEYLLTKPYLLNILSKKEYPLYLKNGSLHHILKNTDKLLGEIKGIEAGKTGWTEKAGGCLLLIIKCRQPQTYVVNVILNSTDRFGDMKKIINYVNRKYKCH